MPENLLTSLLNDERKSHNMMRGIFLRAFSAIVFTTTFAKSVPIGLSRKKCALFKINMAASPC
jgi:hypothetical protein